MCRWGRRGWMVKRIQGILEMLYLRRVLLLFLAFSFGLVISCRQSRNPDVDETVESTPNPSDAQGASPQRANYRKVIINSYSYDSEGSPTEGKDLTEFTYEAFPQLSGARLSSESELESQNMIKIFTDLAADAKNYLAVITPDLKFKNLKDSSTT